MYILQNVKGYIPSLQPSGEDNKNRMPKTLRKGLHAMGALTWHHTSCSFVPVQTPVRFGILAHMFIQSIPSLRAGLSGVVFLALPLRNEPLNPRSHVRCGIISLFP